jgi:hypothetical protein
LERWSSWWTEDFSKGLIRQRVHYIGCADMARLVYELLPTAS